MKIGDYEDDGDNDDVDDEEDVNGYEDTEDGVVGNIEKCQGDRENMRVVVKIVIVKGNLEIPTIAHPQNTRTAKSNQGDQNRHKRFKWPSVFSFKPAKKHCYSMMYPIKDYKVLEGHKKGKLSTFGGYFLKPPLPPPPQYPCQRSY